MGHRLRVTVAKPAGDGAGAARGPVEGRNLPRRLTKRCSLRLPCCAECAFPLRRRPGGVGHNPPPACGALWKMAQLGKRARATPRQAAGGCAERRCRKQTGFGTFAEAATEFRSHPRCSSCGSARAKRDGLAPNDARGWECLGCGRKHGSLAGTAFEHTRRGLPGRVSLIGLMRFSVPLDCIGGRHRRLQNPCAVACGHGKPSHEEDKGGLRRPRSQRRHHRA